MHPKRCLCSRDQRSQTFCSVPTGVLGMVCANDTDSTRISYTINQFMSVIAFGAISSSFGRNLRIFS